MAMGQSTVVISDQGLSLAIPETVSRLIRNINPNLKYTVQDISPYSILYYISR